MHSLISVGFTAVTLLSSAATVLTADDQLHAIPDKLIVLTFDDGNRSDLDYVAPLLKRFGFGATFFISEAWMYQTDDFLSWDDVRKLHDLGFEIGNHTSSHGLTTHMSKEDLLADIVKIENQCIQHGIPRPTSFSNPMGHTNLHVTETVRELGYLFGRRGNAPEAQPADWGRGTHYDPTVEDPMLIPSTFIPGPDNIWNFEDLAWSVANAKDGKIAVLTLHGVRENPVHPWCTTSPEDFVRMVEYLYAQNCTVIAMRDLAKYIDPKEQPNPKDPFEAIERRFGLVPRDLKCEYATNPLSLETQRPRFSWLGQSIRRNQQQTAYHLRVAGSLNKLAQGIGDKWDTGKVVSEDSVHIAYEGQPLSSGERCYWHVRVWDKDDQAWEWSEPAFFEMGLLEQSDWQGKWIAADENVAAPLLRKQFTLNKPVRNATAHVTGVGWHEFYLNGQRVGDHVLDPAPTDYRKRVLYVSHDVTELLRSGVNAAGLVLGDGWYCRRWYRGGSGSADYGAMPRAILQLNVEFADGTQATIVTDDTWKTTAGPITSNDICEGEVYDARLEQEGWSEPGFDDSGWQAVTLDGSPGGKMISQVMPPIKVVQTIPAVEIIETGPGVYVFDFGQHFSGWVRMHVAGPRGTEVSLRFSGRTYDGGHLDTRNNLASAQRDKYILKGGDQETWEPRFTLHGFRYVEVTGFPGKPTQENIEGRFVRSSVERAGHFECSNPLLNQIHHNVLWTFMSSLQGIPQDAAERYERFAWMGDPGFVAEDYLFNLETASFWKKWLDDIQDAQHENGQVPVYVPGDWYGDWPAWQITYPLFVWYVHRYYDDDRVLEQHYEGMERLIAHFSENATNHILPDAGQGDHMEPQSDGSSGHDPTQTPVALTSTAYYYFGTWILAEAAGVLGKDAEHERYAEQAERIKQAFNREFLDEETNQYATGSQCANAMALYLRLVPEESTEAILNNLVDDILAGHQGHLSTGIIGSNALEQSLGDFDRADVMYTITSQTTFPSLGYQALRGATTVWESYEWNSTTSINMKMLGSTELFFFRDLAGIRMVKPGFKKFEVRPQVVGDLTYVDCAYKTPYGLIEVDWNKDFQYVYARENQKKFNLRVTVPVNTTATIHLPKLGLQNIELKERRVRTLWKNGEYVQCDPNSFGYPYPRVCEGVRNVVESEQAFAVDVGSGYYVFQMFGEL